MEADRDVTGEGGRWGAEREEVSVREVRLGTEAKARGGVWRKWEGMWQVEAGKREQRGRM